MFGSNHRFIYVFSSRKIVKREYGPIDRSACECACASCLHRAHLHILRVRYNSIRRLPQNTEIYGPWKNWKHHKWINPVAVGISFWICAYVFVRCAYKQLMPIRASHSHQTHSISVGFLQEESVPLPRCSMCFVRFALVRRSRHPNICVCSSYFSKHFVEHRRTRTGLDHIRGVCAAVFARTRNIADFIRPLQN